MTTKRLYLLLLGFALIGMKAQAQHVSFGPLHSQDSPGRLAVARRYGISGRKDRGIWWQTGEEYAG